MSNLYYYKFDKDNYYLDQSILNLPLEEEFFKFIKRFEYLYRKNTIYFYKFNESDHIEFNLKFPNQTLLEKATEDDIKNVFK